MSQILYIIKSIIYLSWKKNSDWEVVIFSIIQILLLVSVLKLQIYRCINMSKKLRLTLVSLLENLRLLHNIMVRYCNVYVLENIWTLNFVCVSYFCTFSFLFPQKNGIFFWVTFLLKEVLFFCLWLLLNKLVSSIATGYLAWSSTSSVGTCLRFHGTCNLFITFFGQWMKQKSHFPV